MTEEIIINGVDVSGCCSYKDGICLTDKGKCTSMCDYGAYAREEKLKKLEQENQELGKIIDCKNGTVATLVKIRDELRGKNKKLKDTFKEIKTICKEYSENCKIDGNCIDDRLCSTCFFGGAIELIDELNEVLKDD